MSEESFILDLEKDCDSRSDCAYKKHVLEPTSDSWIWACSYCGQTITRSGMFHRGYVRSSYIVLGNLVGDVLRARGPLRDRELSVATGIPAQELRDVLNAIVVYPMYGIAYEVECRGSRWHLTGSENMWRDWSGEVCRPVLHARASR